MPFTRRATWLILVGLSLPPVFLWAQNSRQERLKQQREALQWQVIRPVVRGERAAVAAGTPLVTEASMRLLHAGENSETAPA